PPHWETCRAWFELGQIQDQLGDYAAAWQSWITARQFHAPDIDWNVRRSQAEHVWNHVRSLHRSLDGDHLARWCPPDQQDGNRASTPRLAVLTGHPRSGTTLLEQALDAHSGIVSMEETTLFTSNVYRPLFQHGLQGTTPAKRLDTMPDRERQHWRRQYLGLSRLALGQESGSRLVLDKNPDLLQLLPAWLRIFPEARVIVMLRDPRDLLVSMFSQALPPNHTAWSYRTPEAAAEMVSLRLGLWHHLRKRLPDHAFHEVRYERLVADFAGETGKVLACLGFDPESATLRPEVHSRQKTVRSPTYAAVQSPVHSRAVARWRNYSRWLAPLMKTLRPAIRGLGYAEPEME
ncbi:MAG: sulfotransferase, partial [Verrucomicrobiaceae bacterium]